jgi:hypothetical protein
MLRRVLCLTLICQIPELSLEQMLCRLSGQICGRQSFLAGLGQLQKTGELPNVESLVLITGGPYSPFTCQSPSFGYGVKRLAGKDLSSTT